MSRLFACVILTFVLLSGCGDPDEIRSYTIAKPEPSHRLLGAIILRGDQAWFFKVSGASEDLDSLSPDFRSLIASVRFSAEENASPQWKLPGGWRQKEGSGMRFATIEIAARQGPIPLTVIRLPVMGTDKNAYLLSNLNLWREQLGLGPIGLTQLAAETTEIPLEGEEALKATLVDFAGHDARLTQHAQAAPQGMPGPDRSEPRLIYDVPDGWNAGPLVISRGGIEVRRQAVFEVQREGNRVEITVTSLPGAAGALLANLNRWREQVQLAPIQENELAQHVQEISLGDGKADYVQLFGAEQAILGVVAIREDTTWFVKLQGSRDLAAGEKEHFEAFVGSLKFHP